MMQDWIAILKRKPNFGERVLCCNDQMVFIGVLRHINTIDVWEYVWEDGSRRLHGITHWQPLPMLPQMED